MILAGLQQDRRLLTYTGTQLLSNDFKKGCLVGEEKPLQEKAYFSDRESSVFF